MLNFKTGYYLLMKINVVNIQELPMKDLDKMDTAHT